MAMQPSRRSRHRAGLVALTAGTVVAAALVPVTPAAANGDCVTYWAEGGLWSGAPAAGGTGTPADPYLVGSQTDLSELRYCRDRHFRQIADITMSGEWSPIGVGTPFSGTYDGAGHSIEGMTITLPDEHNRGLFSTTAGATISDVEVLSATVTARSRSAVLVGSATGTVIRKVVVSGTVTGTDRLGLVTGSATNSTVVRVAGSGTVTSNQSFVGGLVGEVDSSTVARAAFQGTVTAAGQSVGGLVGGAENSRIEDAAVKADVTGDNYTGGVVGGIEPNSTVVRSSSDSQVTGNHAVGGITGGGEYSAMSDLAAAGSVSGETMVGGVIGQSLLVDLHDVVSAAAVSGSAQVGGAAGEVYGYVADVTAGGPVTATDSDAGGLVGFQAYGTIRRSRASGTVTSSGERATGGLVGSATNVVEIVDSHATGAVTNTRSAPDSMAQCTGGLVGCTRGTVIRRSSASGAVTAAHGSGTGGLVGEAEQGVIEASVATGDVVSQAAAGGLVGGVSVLARPGRITDSYARGDVTASGDDARVGGLLGEAASDPMDPTTWWTVTSSYATGRVTGPATNPVLVQGLVGGGDVQQLTPSFWNSTANPGLSGGAGEPRTADQLRAKATYTAAGWDIQTGGARGPQEAEWGICVPPDPTVNSGYAFLVWEHDGDPCPAVPEAPVLTSVTGGDTTLAVVADLGPASHPPVTAVQFSLDGGAWRASGGAAGSFTIRGLTNGRTYAVRVRAVNGLGAGPASNTKSGTPTAGPVPPATRLEVAARGRIPLPVDRRAVLVRSVRTNGEVRAVRASCWWQGQKLSRAVTRRLCGLTISGPSTAAAAVRAVPGVVAAERVAVRVIARPQCSGLTLRTTVVARKSGAPRAVFTRQWRVRSSPAVECRLPGTG